MPKRAFIAALFPACLLACTGPAGALEPGEPRLLSCEDRALPADMQRLCEGLQESLEGTMADTGRYLPVAVHRAAPGARPGPLLKREFTARGISAAPARRLPAPLRGFGDDRGVGMRLLARDLPIQFSTEFVQPGDPSAGERMNWELKAEQVLSDKHSGLFWGARTSGSLDRDGPRESAGGFLGIRQVIEPVDDFRIAAQIAPTLDLGDLGRLDAIGALEPKLSADTGLGEIGGLSLRGSMNFGYRLPFDGGMPSHSAGIRFTLTRK